jgi:small-conductance mechanosensitive channel
MIRTIFSIAALCFALALAAPQVNAAGEAEKSKPAAATPEAALETAPVAIDDMALFRVRGASSFPAEERAAAITKRILTVAADPSFRSADLSIDEVEHGAMIMAGDQPLMLVTENDAALEHLTYRNLAKLHLAKIRQAIEEYRRSRSRDVLFRSALYAVAATGALSLAVVLLFPLVRRLNQAISERMKSRIHAVGIQTFEIVRVEQIWKALHALLNTLQVIVVIVLVFSYLHVVLSLFPWTRSLGRRLFATETDALTQLGKAFVGWLPDLLILTLLYFLFRFLLRLLRHFFDALEKQTVVLSGFDAEWAHPTYKAARFALLAFAVIVAYPYLPGSESAAFKGMTVFIGLVFSLGSSAAVSNVIAGYLITYRRVFRVGDRVKVGDIVGNVLSIRLQVTHMLSLKNEEITIPNSQILSGSVSNFSSLARKRGLILHTEVGIGYETPWRQVEAMLIQAAERTQGVLKEPGPYILIKRLGDFAIVYELNVYCDNPQQIEQDYTNLHRNILDVFNEYNVQIMTPAYIADTPQAKLVPREQWYTAPASTETAIAPPRDDFGVAPPGMESDKPKGPSGPA